MEGLNITEIGTAMAAAGAASASIGAFMWRILKPKVADMLKDAESKIAENTKAIAALAHAVDKLALVDGTQADTIENTNARLASLQGKHGDLFDNFKQYKVDDEKAASIMRQELVDRTRDVGNKLYAHVEPTIRAVERLKGLAGIKPANGG